MTFRWELAANGVNTASILLATLNSSHTWWTGIVGCLLFCWVFLQSQLYADATLQIFFVVTSAIGWWNWLRGDAGEPLPVRRTTSRMILGFVIIAVAVALAYGWLLHSYTDAYAPWADAAVLTLSVVAQLLLMSRRYESWWFWLAANSIAIPVFVMRGLSLTAILYAAFWINALVALVRWRRLVAD
jgi:nicotinamide mononucleotide transporter